MIEFLSSNESLPNSETREYLNYPSLILREVKGCKLLSAGAKHCWELLYDLSKFDARRFIDISIKKIKSILSDSKSYRTIQRYLAQLAEHDFITIKKNFDSYGRIENTYSIKVPTSITDKLSESTTKVFIKSKNPVSNPTNPRYDSFVQGNKELNIINNNCYPLEKDEKVDYQEELSTSDIEPEINPDAEVLEYFPAKEKPASPVKAVLRHALNKATKFEALLSSEITQSQENVIRQVISFWTALRFVSSPKECFEWIQSVLLNPKALSGCGNNFLKKMNVIFKMIREKKFSRPFAQRYGKKFNVDKKTNNDDIVLDQNITENKRTVEIKILHEKKRHLLQYIASAKAAQKQFKEFPEIARQHALSAEEHEKSIRDIEIIIDQLNMYEHDQLQTQ